MTTTTAERPENDERSPRRKLPTVRGNVTLAAKQAIDGWSEARAYRRKEAGLEVESGEYKGAGYVVADLVYWFLRRSEEDRERVVSEGRTLRESHEAGGALPEQEGGSAFRTPASTRPPVVEPRGGSSRGPRQRRRKGGEDRPGKGDPGGDHSRPVAEH